MKPLHIHERGAHVVLYNPTDRGLYQSYDELNNVIEELEAKGKEDLIRQGYDAADIRYSLEMDMRYGNQLVTTAVVFDINRVNGVADVLHLIRTFSDIYGQRYGSGSQAPEAGIRAQTVRVSSYVDGDVVKFDSIDSGHDRTMPSPVGTRQVHFVEDRRSRGHAGLRRRGPPPPACHPRPGHRHHGKHHVSSSNRDGAWNRHPRAPCGSSKTDPVPHGSTPDLPANSIEGAQQQ